MSETVKYTPGPWEYIPGNENHGPYVSNGWGAGDICDCYTMSNLSEIAVCNGGPSKPINFQHEEAEANARLIAAAPDLLEALKAQQTANAAKDQFSLVAYQFGIRSRDAQDVFGEYVRLKANADQLAQKAVEKAEGKS